MINEWVKVTYIDLAGKFKYRKVDGDEFWYHENGRWENINLEPDDPIMEWLIDGENDGS